MSRAHVSRWTRLAVSIKRGVRSWMMEKATVNPSRKTAGSDCRVFEQVRRCSPWELRIGAGQQTGEEGRRYAQSQRRCWCVNGWENFASFNSVKRMWRAKEGDKRWPKRVGRSLGFLTIGVGARRQVWRRRQPQFEVGLTSRVKSRHLILDVVIYSKDAITCERRNVWWRSRWFHISVRLAESK